MLKCLLLFLLFDGLQQLSCHGALWEWGDWRDGGREREKVDEDLGVFEQRSYLNSMCIAH